LGTKCRHKEQREAKEKTVSFQKIGIMSIGEMGFHWAKLLKSHGVEVLTYDKDRGEVSRKRGENAGVNSVASMTTLVREADLIVSIVVPFAAKRVAGKVAKAVMKSGRKDLLYLDANAISPMTADDIAKTLIPAGVNFVDGCIIGAAATMGEAPLSTFPVRKRCGSRPSRRFKFPLKSWGPARIRPRPLKLSTRASPKDCRDSFAN
jgi:NAD binding domain of 6-phosphogluconate dehydrogenase